MDTRTGFVKTVLFQ